MKLLTLALALLLIPCSAPATEPPLGTPPNAATELGETALITACKEQQWDLAKERIIAGDDLNASTKYGWTPLLYSALADNQSLVLFLINKGADIEARSGLCHGAACQHLSGIKQQLKPSDISYTPLMWCALLGKTDMARLLLSRGAQIDADGPGSVTPLALAQAEGNTEMVDLLLTNGASIGIVSGAPLAALIKLQNCWQTSYSLSNFVTLICVSIICTLALIAFGILFYLRHLRDKWDD